MSKVKKVTEMNQTLCAVCNQKIGGKKKDKTSLNICGSCTEVIKKESR